ncbi:MAG: hypothetical protein M1838_002180 [Thelocarpon superellum]|nr:MAG: hypothetical protein M1838_002180 [Thelocarpon superellum]
MHWSSIVVTSLLLLTATLDVVRAEADIALAPLPNTFPRSSSPDGQTQRFSLAYAHGTIQVSPNVSLTAVRYGAGNLSQALEAAISEASEHAATEKPQPYFKTSFGHLSLIVKSTEAAPTSLNMTWSDYAALLRILLNHSRQHPAPTLFVGLVEDQNKHVYAEVAILPELIIINQAEIPVSSINSTAATQSTPLRPPDRRLTSDDEDWDAEEVGAPPSFFQDGPVVEGTTLRM